MTPEQAKKQAEEIAEAIELGYCRHCDIQNNMAIVRGVGILASDIRRMVNSAERAARRKALEEAAEAAERSRLDASRTDVPVLTPNGQYLLGWKSASDALATMYRALLSKAAE